MTIAKAWLSTFLAISACLQILSGVSTAAATTSSTSVSDVTFPDLYEASVAELQAGLDAGTFTSVDLVKVSSKTTLMTLLFF